MPRPPSADRQVTNATRAADPLTASTLDVPESHDGSSTFTFELALQRVAQKRLQLQDHAIPRLHGDGAET